MNGPRMADSTYGEYNTCIVFVIRVVKSFSKIGAKGGKLNFPKIGPPYLEDGHV